MTKLDMKKTLKQCYTAKREVDFVEVPTIRYLCIEGKGDPNTAEEFQLAMPVLYGLAYTIKFMFKEREQDFTVMPLEGQWWTDPPEAFSMDDKDSWLWKLMIALPDYVETQDFEKARETLREKKNPPRLDLAVLGDLTDGLSAQFLHIGAYRDEAPHIARMHDFIEEKGYRLRDKHREIYLSDPNRTAEEKLKTIVRHPIEKVL